MAAVVLAGTVRGLLLVDDVLFLQGCLRCSLPCRLGLDLCCRLILAVTATRHMGCPLGLLSRRRLL